MVRVLWRRLTRPANLASVSALYANIGAPTEVRPKEQWDGTNVESGWELRTLLPAFISIWYVQSICPRLLLHSSQTTNLSNEPMPSTRRTYFRSLQPWSHKLTRCEDRGHSIALG